MRKRMGMGSVAAMVMILTLATAGNALAHCDALDGPVITLARQSLEKGDVKIILPWVAADKEGEIRKAFDLTMAVRGKGEKEKELADMYFFETLVRVHREGEGAAYTGLKPSGLDLGPAIPAADQALESGNPGPLLKLMNEKIHGESTSTTWKRKRRRRMRERASKRDAPMSTPMFPTCISWNGFTLTRRRPSRTAPGRGVTRQPGIQSPRLPQRSTSTDGGRTGAESDRRRRGTGPPPPVSRHDRWLSISGNVFPKM